MLKRVLAMILTLSMVVLVFSACGTSNANSQSSGDTNASGESSTENTATSDNGETQTIKVGCTTQTLTWLQPVMDDYNSSQSKYKVEAIEVTNGSDMYTKMTMMMQSPKTCPDIMMEDGFMINSDVAAGKLMALDDVLADWDELSQFVPAILEGSKSTDGKLYAVPISTDTQGIYYNKKLLEAIGISTPWQPKNWAEIIDVAKKLKDANSATEDFIPMFMYASKTTPEETSMRTFQLLLSGTEGNYPEQIYDKESGNWIVDSEKLLQVFNFINDIFNVEKVSEPASFAAQQNVGDTIVSDYMKNEKIGLYFTGSWTMGAFGPNGQYSWDEATDTWGFANVPTRNGGDPAYTTMSGGWTWAIPANANNKDGAVEFIKILGSKDVQTKQLLTTGDVTVRSDIAKESEYLDQPCSSVKEATAQLEFAHFRPSVDGYSSLTTMFTNVVESIAIGSATPDQALENFKTEMIRTVGQDKVIVK